jgi:hypothetical protein
MRARAQLINARMYIINESLTLLVLDTSAFLSRRYAAMSVLPLATARVSGVSSSCKYSKNKKLF